MMEKQYLIGEIISEQQTEPTACFPCFGTIKSINESGESVRVDFEGNSFLQPISARLGRAFRRTELELAINNQLRCRVEFLNQDISLPVVTDIVFSIVDSTDQFAIKATKIVMDTDQELILRSGEAETRYSARDGSVTTQAKYVTSQAQKAQKIQGGTIAIN
ncbi:hypothetical protein MD535_21960 [Vibrio sp. ZSDZ65]|uniref:Uncharacterized protein n=1 Tax=Vibrio qingdaonensis TaxID=2829491 RepID=A0A9X3CS48_9VIBR|nr:hypothetical protein [Vibrio qingdaonensis]MCW8348658.1 hypothetical protein [Vibrio qingdaonensis]